MQEVSRENEVTGSNAPSMPSHASANTEIILLLKLLTRILGFIVDKIIRVSD